MLVSGNSLNLQYFPPVSSSDFNVDIGKGDAHTGFGDASPKSDLTFTNIDNFYINAVYKTENYKHNIGK